MGNGSLKVLEKLLNFLFKKGYVPWTDKNIMGYNKSHNGI